MRNILRKLVNILSKFVFKASVSGILSNLDVLIASVFTLLVANSRILIFKLPNVFLDIWSIAC